MNRTKGWLTGFAVAAQLWFGTVADAMPADFEYRSWNANLDARTKVTDNGSGSAIDLDKDLGISDRRIHNGRITLGEPGSFELVRLEFNNLNYSGNTLLSRSLEFDGATYNAGTRVSSRVQLDYGRIGLVRPLQLERNFQVYSLYDLRLLRVDTSLRGQGVSSSDSFTAPFPTVGVGANLRLSRNANLFAEVSGIPLGKYGHVFDAETGIKVEVPNGVELVGGYRSLSIKAASDDDYFRIKVEGPYAGATIKF